jgi:hypothetical protein
MTSRRNPRGDRNQPEIVAALREVGASVQSLAKVGDGCPDLLVGFQGKNYLIEVKDGLKPASKRGLTVAQQLWFGKWDGEVHGCWNVDGALAIIGRKD